MRIVSLLMHMLNPFPSPALSRANDAPPNEEDNHLKCTLLPNDTMDKYVAQVDKTHLQLMCFEHVASLNMYNWGPHWLILFPTPFMYRPVRKF